MEKKVSQAVIKRLPRYHIHLKELQANGVTKISSRELGEKMGLTASQVRQDFNCFGGFGQQGYGYNVSNLTGEIKRIMGIDRKHTIIMQVGARETRQKHNKPPSTRYTAPLTTAVPIVG